MIWAQLCKTELGDIGIFSSSNDLAKFMQLYLDNGMYGDERFLNESTIKKFTSRQYVFNRSGEVQALTNPVLKTKKLELPVKM